MKFGKNQIFPLVIFVDFKKFQVQGWNSFIDLNFKINKTRIKWWRDDIFI